MDFGTSLIFDFFIGTIGLSYLVYGKKASNFHFIIFGIILMVYTFFIQNLIILILLGIIFVIAPHITNKYL